jgi:ATP-dependent Lhr-like helicase
MEDGLYKVTNRQVALRHRMNIGTIVGDVLMRVKFLGGGFIGTIEENFISRLKPGDAFILAGKRLELVAIKDMDALVRKSTAKNAIVPAWLGGRLPLSASMGEVLRHTYQEAADNPRQEPLLNFLAPLLNTQKALSAIPAEGELLIELITTRDGYHLFVYPFEGRLVHQAMAAMLAYRMAQVLPISFSIAMSDYGFELLSDQPIPLNEDNMRGFFNPEGWYMDLQRSVNAAEMGKRKFRDISVIAGLIFQGYPGAKKKQRHLQNSSSLIYDVLREEEPNHLLLRQADTEVLTYEVEAERLYRSLERIYAAPIILKRPQQLTPFCFPIKVDSLREQLSSEKLEDRVKRMQEQLNRL